MKNNESELNKRQQRESKEGGTLNIWTLISSYLGNAVGMNLTKRELREKLDKH